MILCKSDLLNSKYTRRNSVGNEREMKGTGCVHTVIVKPSFLPRSPNSPATSLSRLMSASSWSQGLYCRSLSLGFLAGKKGSHHPMKNSWEKWSAFTPKRFQMVPSHVTLMLHHSSLDPHIIFITLRDPSRASSRTFHEVRACEFWMCARLAFFFLDAHTPDFWSPDLNQTHWRRVSPLSRAGAIGSCTRTLTCCHGRAHTHSLTCCHVRARTHWVTLSFTFHHFSSHVIETREWLCDFYRMVTWLLSNSYVTYTNGHVAVICPLSLHFISTRSSPMINLRYLTSQARSIFF